MNHRVALAAFVRRCGLMPLANRAALMVYGLRKRLARLRNRSDIDAIYTKKFFAAEEDMTTPTAPTVVGILMDEFRPASVVDLGCGTAVYLKEFQSRGVEIRGYEGSENAIHNGKVDASFLTLHDLRQALLPTRSYDLALCIEVAEHLEAHYADLLAEGLSRLGTWIVFTAAQPGQGGTDHVNEQPSGYWIEKFQTRGCVYEEQATTRLKEKFRVSGCVWWLVHNLLVFHNPTAPQVHPSVGTTLPPRHLRSLHD